MYILYVYVLIGTYHILKCYDVYMLRIEREQALKFQLSNPVLTFELSYFVTSSPPSGHV